MTKRREGQYGSRKLMKHSSRFGGQFATFRLRWPLGRAMEKVEQQNNTRVWERFTLAK